MDISVLGKAKDLRTNTQVVYAQININDYLNLIGEDFDDFRFQRKRTNYKPYQRMKDDIIEGALLPAITLAIKSEYTNQILDNLHNDNLLKKELLSLKGKLLILDGLQRTYILKDILNSGHEFNTEQKILLEFWIEKDIKHLIYRLIVLNAGQKKMSMRHQIELLFLNVKESLEKEIPNLVIHTQRDNTRRDIPGKFALDKIVMGYQSFLLGNTEVKRSNIVAQEMLENNVLDLSSEELGYEFELFKKYLHCYVVLDYATYEHYDQYSKTKNIDSHYYYDDEASNDLITKSSRHWFAEENVITSLFAAISKYNQKYGERVPVFEVMIELAEKIKSSSIYADPLNLKVLKELQNGMNARKSSLDYQTRQMIYEGFIEYLINRGDISFAECWAKGAL